METGDPSNPTTECPQNIANILNDHFINVANDHAKKLKQTNLTHNDFMGAENKSTMFLKLIELHEIIEEIMNLCIRKATGYDEIPPKVIKWAPNLFAPILLVIFNKCIDLGYYPTNMKVGQVAPVYKKGEQNGKNNYRPITVLTQFNQIFEHLLSK